MFFYYLVVGALGMIIGSFLNVCIYRIPIGESIVKPPSHCPKCGKKLKALDLVPVISYILIRGKCRYCKTRISPRYALVEIITGIVFIALFTKYGLSVDFAAVAYLTSILITVFFIDMDYKIIPNELVLAAIIGAVPVVVYNAFNPLEIYGDDRWWVPLTGVLPGCGILFVVAIIGFLIYGSDDAMGMGDVKIFAPIGVFLGWKMCTLALAISIVLGGISGLALIAAKIKNRKDTIPFGPFIVIGTFTTIMWGYDILEWYLSKLG